MNTYLRKNTILYLINKYNETIEAHRRWGNRRCVAASLSKIQRRWLSTQPSGRRRGATAGLLRKLRDSSATPASPAGSSISIAPSPTGKPSTLLVTVSSLNQTRHSEYLPAYILSHLYFAIFHMRQ